MSPYRHLAWLALVMAPVATAAAADIPGGTGTTATITLNGPAVSSNLGTAVDSDWLKTTLVADKLYAFVLVCEDGDF